LRYWKQPEYASFVVYPHCLAFLDLLQHAEFREQLLSPKVVEMIHSQQFYHWQFYRFNRLKNPVTPVPPSTLS
jgi:mediator of RNA polymerase II transcription subunit 31